jgi:RimJ/RimL family protein N-acetyltransferase
MSAQAVCRVAVQRRAATPADLPLLRSLFADSRMELVALSPDSRFVLVDMQFRAQRQQLRAQFPRAEHEILVVDGTDVGRIVVDHSGPDVRIVDITIALGHRRQGIASTVLSEITDDAKAAGRDVRVALWSGNAAARATCERVGLAAVSDEGGYLELALTPAG